MEIMFGVIWLFKSCPKCGGDMHIDVDIFGKSMSCLQCGCVKDYGYVVTQNEAMIEVSKPGCDAYHRCIHRAKRR
jgi:hypothetical protein